MILEPAVSVHRLDACWLGAAATCLHPEEEARARRFHRPVDRDTWRAGRAWVRYQLAAALGTTPASVAFATDSRGRPRVVDAPPGFDCNWSHSGAWIALAVSQTGPVGIDVEVIRPDFPISDVETAICTPGERLALAAAAEDEVRTRCFFRLWTAKEALMKSTGLGAALDPALIDILLQDGRPRGYTTHPTWQTAGRDGDDWTAAWTWCRHA